MKKKLALYTFGIFAKAAKDPANDGFHFLNDKILPQVDRAIGLIERSGYDGEPGPATWGTQVFPAFFIDTGDGWSPSTLSLWVDIESAMAFSYFGLHAEALKRGHEWFAKPKWPPYAAWWVDQAEVPDWTEAVRRHQHLHDHGSTPTAFNFKQAFDSAGNKMVIDRQKTKLFADQNALVFGE
jgi:Domain of unknown function (DUF3291)